MTEPLIRPTQATRRPANGRLAEDLRTTDHPITNGDLRFESEAESPPGTPRWVKLFGIGAVVLVLLVAGLHLTGHTPTHGMPAHDMPMQTVQQP